MIPSKSKRNYRGKKSHAKLEKENKRKLSNRPECAESIYYFEKVH